MDEVFKALADPTRRELLDALFRADGQTLTELEGRLPLSRFGVMKHLRVLETAGLVISRKHGRRRLHYLNPVPIHQLAERWIGKYARPWASALTGLKATLEEEQMSERDGAHVYEIYIRTTPERLWEAITDPDQTERYFHGTRAVSDFAPGSSIEYRSPDGTRAWIRGEVLEVEAPRRLVHTFVKLWGDREPEPASRVAYEIEPIGEACRLRLVHDGLVPGGESYRSVEFGWNEVMSGLKTLLETGEPLGLET